MAQGFSLNDQLFNAETVATLLVPFEAQGVNVAALTKRILQQFPPLALKERISCIATELAADLPNDFDTAAKVIEAALPAELDPSLTDDDFGHFVYASLGDYVARFGIDHPTRAMACLNQITRRFSAEYAIRPFFNQWPDEVFATLNDWAQSDNYHVRRLVSEGTRPKLPWGIGIESDYQKAVPLLTDLHADKTRFVTRSVANHLNDISKFDPALVIATLKDWAAQGRQDQKELAWMTRHALRGLIKAGDPAAMEVLGYRADADLAVASFELDRSVLPIGEAVELSAMLTSDSEVPVIVDYVMHFRKSGGQLSPKVHKWKDAVVRVKKPLKLTKKHVFKGNATTFKLYPGVQEVTLQVNGKTLARLEFELTE